MQGIDREITLKYELDIKSIVPLRDSYELTTQLGKKILKRSNFSAQRILFIHGAKEHLYKNNFTSIDRYLITTDGLPYINIEGVNYVITEFIEGKSCNLNDRKDLINASKVLASFHKASKGYNCGDGARPEDNLGRMPVYFTRRLDEIRRLKKIALKRKDKFDYLYLDYADYFLDLGSKVIELLLESDYHYMVSKARRERGFCHHDFTHHNIILGEDRISIINFDYCCYELKIYDIANFLRRKLRKSNWSFSDAKLILDEYRKVEAISKSEIAVMRLILMFPQKFWRVANRYYNSRRSWAEKNYIIKLQEVIDEIKYHEAFIKNFDELM